jgi:cytoskeleton protein RodZ
MSEIVISASATSWIEIVKANGEIVVSKLLRKGDQFVATADTDLFLSTGNAGGIQLAIGEHPAVQIGRVGEIIRDLALSRDGLSLLKNNTQF